MRIKTEQKIEAALSVLLEEGPLSISGLAERVASRLRGRANTMRSALVPLLKQLEEMRIIEHVGSDRFGSKLLDVTPSGFMLLKDALTVYGEGKYLKLESLRKFLVRRAPDLLPLFNLILKIGVREKGQCQSETLIGELLGYCYGLAAPHLPRNWEQLKKQLMDEAVSILIERIPEINKIMSMLTPEDKKTLKKVAKTAIEATEEEIKQMQKTLSQLRGLLNTLT